MEVYPLETKVITAHVPVSLADKVNDLSQRLERSKAWIVKQALGDWVAQEEERHRLTLEAIQDIDDDNVTDHQTVQTWANSLDTDKPMLIPR